ncbi:17568_t:CDS:2, partial [Rhizophagus irregularis]
ERNIGYWTLSFEYGTMEIEGRVFIRSLEHQFWMSEVPDFRHGKWVEIRLN